jgi:hypothetical protein
MLSSLRLLCVLRCLGGNIKSGFGGLGGGMSSALVGGGYGWDGWVVCFVGGLFSWGGRFGEGVGFVFVGRARSDSGECVLGWGAGWVGVSGEKKNLLLCGSF